MTRAEVVDGEAFLLLDSLECTDMTIGEVHNMDVITNSCSVVSIIVIAKNTKLLTDADGGLCDIWHQVVGNAVGVLTNQTRLVGTDGVEVAQQNNVPFRVSLLDIHQHLLNHRLGPSIRIGTLPLGTFLCNGNDGRVSINRCAGREDDVLATMLSHHINENEHTVHVGFIVHERLSNRFSDGLKSCEVDDCINLMLGKDFVHSSTIADIGFNQSNFMTDDFLNATDCLRLRVIEIIHYHYAVACLIQLDEGMTADITGTSC